MFSWRVSVLVLLEFSILVDASESEQFEFPIKAANDCVPWTNYNKEHQKCVCKEEDFFDGVLKCNKDSQKLYVIDCYCMTYNETTDSIEVGACIENCLNSEKSLHDKVYKVHFSPNQQYLSQANDYMCSQPHDVTRHRSGRLCGACKQDYYLQAYSYNISCINCTEGNMNLLKYFAISIGPLTVFYFLLLFFKVNTTSSHLHGYVIFAQAISLPPFARTVLLLLESYKDFGFAIKFLSSFFGVWNLDFFRLFNWAICLKMAPLTIVALDYIIAIYPFLLTVISYAFITLHDRNVKIVVFACKPLRSIFKLFRKNWDIRTSVIDAYATFFLLSTFKILSISFDLLIPTFISVISRTDHPQKNAKLALYFDSTIDYFGHQHLPYALLALTLTLLFAIFPILILLIYPCRCFQYLLNRFCFNSFILRTFIDSLNGCYKDGTEPGTRDCRWFAAVDLISRFCLYLVFMITLGSLYFPFAILIIFLLLIFMFQIQPHKTVVSHYTKIDLTFYILLALHYSALSAANIASTKARFYTKGLFLASIIVAFIPLLYITCLCFYWVFTRRRFGRTLINRIRTLWRDFYKLDNV